MARDYEITVKVRNGRILSRALECGYESIAELSRASGITYSRLVDLVAMREKPIGADGDYRPFVETLAALLQCEAEDLFTDTQRNGRVVTNTGTVFLDEPEFARLSSRGDFEQSLVVKSTADRLLSILNPREADIIARRISGETLYEAGASHGITAERVRQIESKSLRKMRAHAVAIGMKDEICGPMYLLGNGR